MKSLCIFFAMFCAANAFHFTENDHDNPIKEVRGDQGLNDHDRVQYIKAVIEPHHVRDNDRVNFPRTTQLETYFAQGAAAGDERGHLVAAQFSGPPLWYNLSPQNPRVNRNAGYQSITTDWFNTECEAREFLDLRGSRTVVWEVTMTYEGKSNRPKTYNLHVTLKNGSKTEKQIQANIQNPLLNQDSDNWICRVCRQRKHKAGEPNCARARA